MLHDTALILIERARGAVRRADSCPALLAPLQAAPSGPCKSSILAARYHARNMARSRLFPLKIRDDDPEIGEELRYDFYVLFEIVLLLFTLLIYIFHPPRGTYAFIVTNRLLLARKRPLAGRLEIMLMQSGDLWHCTNPACRAELRLGPSRQPEVDHVYCPCGGVMKKHYIPPTFTYLDFLGERKDSTYVSPSLDVLTENVRKD